MIKSSCELIPLIKQNRLFVLEPKPLVCLAAKHKLIHRRLGHLGEESLNHLLNPKNKLLADYNFEKDQNDCVPCKISNLKVKKFGSRNYTIASKVLELIHTDICGPFDPTIFGERYYITFTDDYSRYLTVYLLKSKDESIKMFEIYKKMAEILHNGKKIIKIHSDRGGEYTSNNWKEFCTKEGIQISFSPRKTPQLNAVAESANRIVNWKIRAVLADSGLPKEYWGFAAKVCTLYKNMSPTSKKEYTPFEHWFGKKPNLKMQRVFGCLCFYKEPSMPKFEPQTNKGILLGYDDDLTSYCIMNMSTRRIIFTREAKFDENNYPQLESHTVNNEIDYDDDYLPPKTKSVPAHPIKMTTKPVPTPIEQNNDNAGTSSIMPTPNLEFVAPKMPINAPKTPISTPKLTTNTPIIPFPKTQQSCKTPISIKQTKSDPISEQNTQLETASLTPSQLANQVQRTPTAIPFTVDPPKNPTPKEKKMKISQHKEFKLIEEGKVKLGERKRKPNPKFANLVEMVEVEPISYDEAINSANKEQWQKAMEEEMEALAKNNTWKIVPKPSDQTIVRCKWVYKIKRDQDGSPTKFKARLVAVGSSQKEGIDFDEISSPVVRWETIRIMLNIAVQNDLPIVQCDVNSAYLYGEIDRDIFMSQPPGFKIAENVVCKLNKSLYGLKQSGKIWNTNLTNAILEQNYSQSNADPCLFFKGNNYVLIYVDDIVIIGKDTSLLENLQKRFSLKVTKAPKFLLNVKLDITQNQIYLSQPAYIDSILSTFKMQSCNPKVTPADTLETEDSEEKCDKPYREAIGTLIYLATISRPDLAFIVNYLARKMNSPLKTDWQIVKRVFRYLAATKTLGINLRRTPQILIIRGYCDADLGGDRKTGRSTSGNVLLVNNNPVLWKSKLQKATAISTMEAELYSLIELVKDISWFARLCEETKTDFEKPIQVFIDNQSTIKFIANSTTHFHTRAKHIRVKYHFIMDLVNEGLITISYVPTTENLADILTKLLKGNNFTSNAKRITNST